MLLALLACVDPTDTGKPADTGTPDSDSSSDSDSAGETDVTYAERRCVTPTRPDGLPEPSVDPDHDRLYRVVHVPDDELGSVGVIVYVPDSDVAGLWNDGAPVFVTSWPPESIAEPYYKAELGLVEVEPLYPGTGRGELEGTGEYDGLGPNSARALAVSIRFAAGVLTTEEGWTVDQVADRAVCNGEVFLLAVSQGGSPTGQALTTYANELGPLLAGVTNFESATLPQIMAGDVGKTFGDPDVADDADRDSYAWDDARNVDYAGCTLETCSLDYSTIAYSTDHSPIDFFPPFYLPQTLGMLYLDRDGDGQLTAGETLTDADGSGAIEGDEDFPLISHQGAYEGDDVLRLYPTLEALDAAIEAGVLDEGDWPAALATRAQSEAYWLPRTVTTHVPDHAGFPEHARFTAVYSDIDHGVPLPDRPHVTGLYAAFQAQGWPVSYNDVLDGVGCAGVSELLGDWGGPPAADVVLGTDELDTYALPEEIDNHGKTAAVLQQAIRTFGPFDNCP